MGHIWDRGKLPIGVSLYLILLTGVLMFFAFCLSIVKHAFSTGNVLFKGICVASSNEKKKMLRGKRQIEG